MSRARRVPAMLPAPKAKKPKRPSWNQMELLELSNPTRFNDDPELGDAVYVIRMLKQQTTFLATLRKLLGPKVGCYVDPLARSGKTGPKRGKYAKGGEGDFVLLFFGYLLLQKTAMMAMTGKPLDLAPLYAECGFSEAPDYQLMRLRFIEIEEHWDAFCLIGDEVIKTARRWQPEIGRFFHVDATGFETQARPEHCCPRSHKCKRSQTNGRGRSKRWVDRAPAKDMKDERKDDAARPTLEADERAYSVAPRTNLAAGDVPAHLVPDDGLDDQHSYFLLDGCIYRARDASCGMRAYGHGQERAQRTWVGGFGQAAVDHLTGGALSIEVYGAEGNEFQHYPQLLEGVLRALGGDDPWAMTGDAGLGYIPVYELNTKAGLATVVPWRPKGKNTKGLSPEALRKLVRCDLYDEYGVPRCQECGGEAEQLAFFVDGRNDKPYIRYECKAPWAPECEGTKRIACELDWTMLVPLPRTNPLYTDLHTAHWETVERFFANFGGRYLVFGDDKTSRLKRFHSVPAQRLRAQAARFLDWFKICLRHGWLAGHKTLNPIELIARNGIGANGHQGMLTNRRKRQLDLPYGAAAKRCGLARAGPPPGPPPIKAQAAAVAVPLPPITAEIPF